MNRSNIILSITFALIVLFQIIVFNKMNLLGFVNPMIYLLFLVIYPFDSEQTLFILFCFLLGFSIDFLSQSGGAHTIATLTISFLRPIIIKNSYGIASEIPNSFQNDIRIFNKYLFLSVLIGLHHLLYFVILYFNWSAIQLILKNAILTFVFSLILISLLARFFKKINDS